VCGIAGIWRRSGEPVDRLALDRMGAILAHRGPDGSGAHVAGEIGLANRRLRILDLSAAADQPMGLPDGSLWVTFNGEIHNYLELRRELESRGVQFRTRTDTEVVLNAYAIWGSDCFERFNGMWALALWSARERQLVLSRDRFGIKPLYYSVRRDRVCFASEAKAILAAFPEERGPDVAEIERFLAGGYPDAGEATFFENVKSLGTATYAVFSREAMRSATYWSFTPGDETPKPDAEERFRALLADAVRLRTRSDVPIGACVSGGLDSSAIIGLLDRSGAQPRHCFSVQVDDPAFDESRYAALAAGERGLIMHWVRPDPRDMLETMRRIVWHHDAPTPMRGRYAQWFVMREASRHVKVVLDGQGGDELLAGYPRDVLPYLIDRVRRGASGTRRPVGLLREIAELGKLEASRRWFLLTAARRYLRDPRARGARPYASMLNNVLWNGLRHGLPEVLHAEDALSMAFSVESRTPFLDHRIVELCFSLPFHDKISDGWTKSLLRRSLTGVVPPEILARRRKFGFLAPIPAWLRLEPNGRAVRELLLDPRSLQRGIFEARSLERALKAFHRGPPSYASMRVMDVWRWITLELWFRELVDGAGF
jgi:asparagine synthase (glutamine-hydrolysing)